MYKEYDYVFKIVIVGASSVGKSSILKRFADGDFNSKYISTIGVDFRFKSLNIDGKAVKLQVWDTAGQERFQSLAKSYYKGAHAVILVYDVKAPQTFEQISKYWISELQQQMENRENVFVAVNKCDSADEQPSPEHITFLQSRAMQWFPVSAKLGTNVNEMFEEITGRMMHKFPPAEKKSHQSIILQESMREQIINKRCCK